MAEAIQKSAKAGEALNVKDVTVRAPTPSDNPNVPDTHLTRREQHEQMQEQGAPIDMKIKEGYTGGV